MKTSTQAQLNQFLAQLLTTADPDQMQHGRMQAAIKDIRLAERFYSFVNNYEVVSQTPCDAIPLAAHKAQPMSELFRDGGVKYYYRNSDLDRWFDENSPECLVGTARLVKTPKVMTFWQMAQWVTGLKTESLGDLSRAIVAQNLDITTAQWNDQIVATQQGANILLTNGYVSFAFAKTGKRLRDEKGEYDEIVVLCAARDGDGVWFAYVDRLGSGYVWHAVSRLLLRNSP